MICVVVVDTRSWSAAHADSVVASVRSLVTTEERRRADSFRFRCDRDAFVVARATARHMASEALDIDPSDLEIDRTCAHCGHASHGKPRFLHVPFEFSVSHSKGVVVVAASVEVACGVDVELRSRESHQYDAVIRRLPERERDSLLAMCPRSRVDAFLEVWTRREAYCKGVGLGVVLGLTNYEVSVPPDPPAILRPAPGQGGWRLAGLDAGADVIATLAYRADVGVPYVALDWPLGRTVAPKISSSSAE